MSQLADLAKPFAERLIHAPAPGKYGKYVSHDAVNQKLLAVLGPFSFEVVEIIRDVEGRVDGCLARLTAFIDGERIMVVEAGECDNVEQKKTNGDRLKNASSDAFKRCAMRIGCGLHLWADDYFLHDVLLKREQTADGGGAASETSPPPSVGTEGQS